MVDEQYSELESILGLSIDDAMDELIVYKERGEKVFIKFNGEKLYSDIDTLDSAYLKITGQSKKDFDLAREQEQEDYKEILSVHNLNIPSLTQQWIEKGKVILEKDKWELWEKCVPIRLSDLYRGMELGCCLDIIEILKTGDYSKAKQVMYDQDHSGMSFGLVCSMIESFYDDGYKFIKMVR